MYKSGWYKSTEFWWTTATKIPAFIYIWFGKYGEYNFLGTRAMGYKLFGNILFPYSDIVNENLQKYFD